MAWTGEGQITLLMFFLFVPHLWLTLPLPGTKHLPNAHPFAQSSPSHPPSLMSFWMTLFSYQIQNLMRKIESTLEQNPHRNRKRKSTILVFYYHLQNKKKKENGPMEDEETPEDSSNTSPDNSPSKPLCPSGAQDAEPSAVTPGKAKAE